MCAMDKYGNIDQNWYSSEAQKSEREHAEQVLKEMKDFEKLCKKFRKKIVEKTTCGVRIRYKKNHEYKNEQNQI